MVSHGKSMCAGEARCLDPSLVVAQRGGVVGCYLVDMMIIGMALKRAARDVPGPAPETLKKRCNVEPWGGSLRFLDMISELYKTIQVECWY